MKSNKGSIIGLLPLIIFLAIYFAVGIGSGSFDNMPLMIGISIAIIVALIIKNPVGENLSFEEKITMFCKGGGDDTLILMVLIFLLAGAFYSVANSMGAVSSIVNIGITFLPANLLLPGLFLIGCVLSFSMGTSMGTVSALVPIAIAIAATTGVSLPLICGVVVGGAMFGDNLSFISDTTIAATRTQEVKMKDKFKANILMVLPAVIINVILLVMVPVTGIESGATYAFDIVNILPYVAIIVLSLVGLNVITVMGIGILTGLVIGVAHGDFTMLQTLGIVHTGMTWMEDMALIAVLVGGLVALMKHYGGIDFLLNRLTKNTKTSKGAELSIAALVSLLDIATTNNTISIIAAGPIAKDIGDKFGISRQRIASILDLYSAAFNGLLPYAGQLLVAAGLAGISPTTIVPYVWYCILMLISATVMILLGLPKKYTKSTLVVEESVA